MKPVLLVDIEVKLVGVREKIIKFRVCRSVHLHTFK